MAVTSPSNPNVANYDTVISQLQNRANLELKRPELGNTLAGAVNDTTEKAFEVGKIYLQHKLATDLQDQKDAFEGRGDMEVTQDMADQFQNEFGVGMPFKVGTKIPADAVKKVQDSLQEGTKVLHSKEMNDLMTDPHWDDPKWKSKVLTTLAGAGKTDSPLYTELSKDLLGAKKLQRGQQVIDPNSSTGYRWYYPPAEQGQSGQYGDEAPAPGSGSGPKPKPISSADRKAAIDRNALVDTTQRLFDNYSPGNVGMVSGRINELEQKTGIGASAKGSTFASTAAGLKNTVLNLRNGQRISQSEADRLLAEIPDPHSSPTDFTTRLQNFANAFNEIQDQYGQSLSEGGFTGVPAVKKISIPEGWGPNGIPKKKAAAPEKNSGYKTPDDVKVAMQAGKLKKQDAAKILQEQFGYGE